LAEVVSKQISRHAINAAEKASRAIHRAVSPLKERAKTKRET